MESDAEADSSTHIRCRLCGRWYQAITFTHLKYKHAMTDPGLYKEEFSLRKITAPEVRRRLSLQKMAVGARGLEYLRKMWGKVPQKKIADHLKVEVLTIQRHARRLRLPALVESWNRGKILAGIRSARRAHVPLHSGSARRALSRLYRRARYHFGSWKKAVEAAGIRYSSVVRRGPFERWSRERIFREIRALSKRRRHRDYRHIHRHRPKLYTAARNYFGSWDRAVRRALKK